MQRYLYILFLLLVYCSVLSQEYNRMTWLADPSCKPPACWYLQDSTTLDTTQYRIYYQLTFIPDTISKNQKTTVMVCEHGHVYDQYYSLAQRFQNRIRTGVIMQLKNRTVSPGERLNSKYTNAEKALKAYAGNADYINGEIWFNHFGDTLTERVADLGQEHLLHAYTEPIPAIEWQISDQMDSLHGYQCFRADCRFRGRDWSAWFTPGIPLNSGPWKFNGLPGLILKVYDRQRQYVWVVDQITNVLEPMVYYNVPMKTHSKKSFDKLQKNVHMHPYEAIDGGRGITRIITMNQGTACDVDVSAWTLPYNPIERE